MKRIYNNINLVNRNSFGVVESAATLVEFDTVDDLREYFADQQPRQWYVLGAGNNTLFTKFYDGVLIVPKSAERTILCDDGESVDIRVEAAHDWDELVAWSVEQGLWGIENLSAIPSSVGAAPVQNIGAYGAEAKDAITVVEYFDTRTMEVVRLNNEECRFAYRESIFKQELKGVAIILAVELRLCRTPRPNLGYGDVIKEVESRGGATLSNIRDAICAIRSSKLPDPKVLGNAGSFFKNPIVEREVAKRLLERYADMPHYPVAGDDTKVKLAAGWLIDRSGLKGYRQGAVGVHERQALVLVNYGGATGGDVIALAEYVCGEVKRCFGVEISPEVNIL
ncbi:MAG: UDP-N-acetylmuramate dehydrogenase [Alistipes sp.]|nr:UDP-N-acetylmuramate dehydrogenase [Alistipes sp.]MBO7263023.1 UDP-N-acetylmuramate dehydrogenase [Alistipes sp.]